MSGSDHGVSAANAHPLDCSPCPANGVAAHHDDHGHDHGHEHDEQHRHDHPAHGSALRGWLTGLVRPHSHDATQKVDTELEASARGIRAVVLSFGALFVTAALQAVVVALSGSVALLGDTLHNTADALTAVPLAIAFTLGRRQATRRFTYGYGRSEDLAGLIVLTLIAASAALAGYEAVTRLVHPHDVDYLVLVACAGLIGFAGNELVARYRIKVGREIGSAALVADGLHARTDGLTSLAVLIGAGGVAVGLPAADPIIGLVITLAILAVLRQATREVFARLMDAVDPTLLDTVEATLRDTPGVLDIGSVRLRWIGHSLRAECEIVVDHALPVIDAHAIAVDAEHRLLHDVPRLAAALVHADPEPVAGVSHHEATAHHQLPET